MEAGTVLEPPVPRHRRDRQPRRRRARLCSGSPSDPRLRKQWLVLCALQRPQWRRRHRPLHRLQRNPDLADADSGQVILKIPHRKAANHNGGMLAFGPTDGYLYIAVGDGGTNQSGERPEEDDARWGRSFASTSIAPRRSTPMRFLAGNPFAGERKGAPGDLGVRVAQSVPLFLRSRYRRHVHWRCRPGATGRRSTLARTVQGESITAGHIMEGGHCYQPSEGLSQESD